VRIKIENLSEEPTLFDIEDGLEWAHTAAAEGMSGKVLSLSGVLSLSVQYETLLVHGELKATCRRECDRCGGFLLLEIEGPVELAYRPEIQSSEAVRELSNADLDVGFYADGIFEVADAVCEHLALQIPLQVHCELSEAKPEGGECQAFLLEEPKEDKVDSRFAILKELKFDN
jgi:uncharacterized metal-binding protein YceD (DUF177 family)